MTCPGASPRPADTSARCVLQVLNHLVEGGDVDELQRVISRHGRTIRGTPGAAASEAAALTQRFRTLLRVLYALAEATFRERVRAHRLLLANSAPS